MKLPDAIQQAQMQAAQTGQVQHVVLRAEYEPQAPGAHAEWQVFTEGELGERGITTMMIARTFGSPVSSASRDEGEGDEAPAQRPVRGMRTRTVRRSAPPAAPGD